MVFDAAFTAPFLRGRLRHPTARIARRPRARSSFVCCGEPLPRTPRPYLSTRRTFVSSLGALLAFSASAKLERVLAADGAAALASLQQMRARVDDIDGLISSARWDAVRTVLATRPVVGAKDACNGLLAGAPQDLAGAIVGLREDLLSAIRLLDTSVYANVFVGEDRQILGTKVDFDVPRTYLGDVKETLDALIEIARS